MSKMNHYDIIIVGAGIAGASIAYELSHNKKILILEQEFSPGYHATGRSAAFWSQTYGGPYIEPLTSASGDFLKNPPSDFHDKSFLRKRGVINIAQKHQKSLVDDMVEQFANNDVLLAQKDKIFLQDKIPNLKSDWHHAVWEPDCCDIDVSALHNAYVKAAQKNSVEILCSAQFLSATQNDNLWNVKTNKGDFSADILVNAAGAWADQVAEKSQANPIAISPYRRTVIELEIGCDVPEDLPLIVALDGSFYIKALPNNHIWLSPHDETPSMACDAAADEMDVAIAIDRFQNIVDWDIVKITHKWAGLRSFSRDRLPVIGFDKNIENFFWFAGQGGFGIQTSPIAAKIAAHQILQNDASNIPNIIELHRYSPDRFA